MNPARIPATITHRAWLAAGILGLALLETIEVMLNPPPTPMWTPLVEWDLLTPRQQEDTDG